MKEKQPFILRDKSRIMQDNFAYAKQNVVKSHKACEIREFFAKFC